MKSACGISRGSPRGALGLLGQGTSHDEAANGRCHGSEPRLFAWSPLRRPGGDPARTPAWSPAGFTESFATQANSVSSFSCWVGGWGSAQGLRCHCRVVAWRLAGSHSAEGQLLRDTFGAEHDPYRARTWRLLPISIDPAQTPAGCLDAGPSLNLPRARRPMETFP
jgi:hypothetical protein